MNIIEFRHDPQLLGAMPHMRDPKTQRRWDVFLKAVYGLPLDDAEVAIFREHTDREVPRPGGYPESVLITGRQSGKTQTVADMAVYEVVTAPADGSAVGTYALLTAQDHRGAVRALFRAFSAPFERIPMLALEIAGQQRTADSLGLRNGMIGAAYPCRPSALRGPRARFAGADELAHMRTSDGNPIDLEMLRALRPTLATTGGKLVIMSSPYGQAGALWELHRLHFGREDSATLVWVASAPAMNPTLPADYLQRMEQDDPEAYRSEVLGEFRTGISTFLDPEALQACVAEGRARELPPAAGVSYFAFADVSGGQRDATTVSIAHREQGRVVIDAVRAWAAPHNPEQIITGELAPFVKTYGCTQVTGDRYGGQFPASAAARAGLSYVVGDLDRSALYRELLPLVLSETIEIPNDPHLLRELRGLERRRGFGGKDRVDHRAGSGSHDDRANALAGAAHLAAEPAMVPTAVRVVGW